MHLRYDARTAVSAFETRRRAWSRRAGFSGRYGIAQHTAGSPVAHSLFPLKYSNTWQVGDVR